MDNMSSYEFSEWIAYFNHKQKLIDKERNDAKNKAKSNKR